MKNNQKGFANLIILVVLVLLIGGGGYVYVQNKNINKNKNGGLITTQVSSSTLAVSQTNLTTQVSTTTQTIVDLEKVFDLDKKEVGTKIYYSDKLGVGFTYLPNNFISVDKIIEKGNKITLANYPSIEVFTKDPTATLEEAIKEKFLNGYNPKDCFVKMYEGGSNYNDTSRLPNYLSAGISYPKTELDPNTPFWKNSEKCPQEYAETNAVQYFLMNKDVPGKFIFLKLGQDSVTSDGSPVTSKGGFDWSHSIRILK